MQQWSMAGFKPWTSCLHGTPHGNKMLYCFISMVGTVHQEAITLLCWLLPRWQESSLMQFHRGELFVVCYKVYPGL